MKMPEIVVIASDFDLYNLTVELKKEFNLGIGVIHAFLDDAVSEAFKLQAQGVKILVSRGGTAKKIMEAKIETPLIQIPITHLDVLRLIAEAKKISNKIAIVGFTDPLVKTASELGRLLEVDIREYIVDTKHDVSIKVLKAIEEGANVIIGAQLAVSCAKQYGVPSALLKTPKDVVLSALEEAGKMLDALKKEREWGQRQQTILDTISQGIIAFDSRGTVVGLNSVAADTLQIKEGDMPAAGLFHLNLRTRLLSGEILEGEIGTHNGESYVCNMKSIVVDGRKRGGILSFQKLSSFQEIESKTRRNLTEKGLNAVHRFSDILTQDSVMQEILVTCDNYSKLNSTVLIYGESGTGKELIAQSIHNASRRSNMPFVAVNCAALPENLLESELFGYAEGAFTGAKKGGKIGLFELAHNGTLFLDEIGEISPAVQARLLRVLEQRQIIRIGDDRIIPIDVRIICATNKDLSRMVKEDVFRQDLYYRINVLKVTLPPLAKRPSDTLLLCRHFLQNLSSSLSLAEVDFDQKAEDTLTAYSWPGNIRELRNLMERVIINHPGKTVTASELLRLMEIDLPEETADISPPDSYFSPTDLLPQADLFSPTDLLPQADLPLAANSFLQKEDPPQSLMEQSEKHLIEKALAGTAGNKTRAAALLGISPATFWRKLKKYGIGL